MLSKLILVQYILTFVIPLAITRTVDNQFESLLLDKKIRSRGKLFHHRSSFSSNSDPLLRHIVRTSYDAHEEQNSGLDASLFEETQIGNSIFSRNSILNRDNEVYSFGDAPGQQLSQNPGTIGTVVCTRPGYAENPDNCQKFYNCIKLGHKYQLFSLDCVDGTIFYSPISKCVNPSTINPKSMPICNSEFNIGPDDTTNKSPTVHLIMGHAANDGETPGGHTEFSSSEHFLADNSADTISNFLSLDEIIEPDSPSEEMVADLALNGKEILDDEVETFFPIVSQNYSRAPNIDELEMDYSEDPDVDINIFDSNKGIESAELFQLETSSIHNKHTPSSSRTRVRAARPKVWFGFRGRDQNHVSSIGNPFRDDETTLAVILDFATSRLQIYSKNKLPK